MNNKIGLDELLEIQQLKTNEVFKNLNEKIKNGEKIKIVNISCGLCNFDCKNCRNTMQ